MVVLGWLSQAIAVYGAFQIMRGERFDLLESVRIGLRRFFPVIGLAVTVTVLWVLALIPLVVPGIILLIMWFVVMPACVVEQLGPIRSMGRSRELTKSYRWRVFGLNLLILIPALLFSAVIGAAVFYVANIGNPAANPAFASMVGHIANLIWSAIWSGFAMVVVVVSYHDLRVAKEGIDTDQIAKVFD
jgi:hypothetical protein